MCGERNHYVTRVKVMASRWLAKEKGQKERRSQGRTFQRMRGRGGRNPEHLVPIRAHCRFPRPIILPLALEMEGEPSSEKLAR